MSSVQKGKDYLAEIQEAYAKEANKVKTRIIVCAGTGCVASGSLRVFEALVKKVAEAKLPVVTELKAELPDDTLYTSKSGCQGFCQMGPLVTIDPDGILYTKVKVEDVDEIVTSTIMEGKVIERLLYKDSRTKKVCRGVNDIPFYVKQTRTVLEACGKVDPEDVREYIARGGYAAARRAFLSMTSEEICEEVLASGLRGRGGGGFPTGRKWDLTRKQKEKKYVICNGDEGDPGAFMDRSVMEGNPHSIVEGMMIAARAIGADEGYLYIRAEYPLAVERIRKAVAAAESLGLLGENIFGSEYSLRLHVMEGAGAFVCGEETALMASIQG